VVELRYVTHGKGTASYRHALELKHYICVCYERRQGCLEKRPGISKVTTISDDWKLLSEAQHAPLDLNLIAKSSQKLRIPDLVLNPIPLDKHVVMSRTL
jgi:hypothetical protein